MPEERAHHDISEHERAEREHSASPHRPVVAPEGVELEGVPDPDCEQDRVARAAHAVGPHTQTDPLRLLKHDDRAGQRS